MDLARFILLTGVKALGLLFLALLASKAVGSLKGSQPAGRRPSPGEWLLYGMILTLVALGALTLGYDVAAENYMRTSVRNLAARDGTRALSNSQRAVALRPGNLAYWQTLSGIKFAQKQHASTVADAQALTALGGGKLDEPDAYRLAVAHYLLGEYSKVHPLTQDLMRASPAYAAPQVLEGYTLMAERHYDQATKSFMDVLRMYPNQQTAVEGLAHVQFLSGNRAAAISILEQTSRYPFAPEARRRFEALKGLYALP